MMHLPPVRPRDSARYPTQDTTHSPARNVIRRVVPLLLCSLVISGCVSTTRTIDPDSDTNYDARYGFADKKAIVEQLTDSLLATDSVNGAQGKPIVVVYGVVNETSEHISTSGITDDIRLRLLQSGTYRFVNREQRNNLIDEADYQYAGYVDPAQRIEEGRQLGADYILSGTLRSIEKRQPRQWRLNKRELVYYSMNLELTNVTTGEISWADAVELAREASRPVIGW